MKNAIVNIIIVLGFTLLGGFVDGFLIGAGLLGGAHEEVTTGASALGSMAGFCLAGCRVPLRRGRHLVWLAAAFFLVNVLYCTWSGLSDGSAFDPAWFAGVIVGNLGYTLVCAGVGGVLSMAIMSTRAKSAAHATS